MLVFVLMTRRLVLNCREYTRRKLRDFIRTVDIGMKRLKMNDSTVDVMMTEGCESVRTEKKRNYT